MAMHVPTDRQSPKAARHFYRRPLEPVYFPESEEVPESNRHLEIRTALYQLLKLELAERATIGSDQFVYWDPTTARKRLAPDVFVRLGARHETFTTWKTWKRGAPDLGVEIVSRSDEAEEDWNEKLARYRAAGIGEVVRFDAADRVSPIRVWDLVESDLVEREPSDPALGACEALGLWWTVVEHPSLGPMPRLARDREGTDLLPTLEESQVQAREAESKAREAESEARAETAAARETTARLEAELSALRAQLAGTGTKTRKPRASRKK